MGTKFKTLGSYFFSKNNLYLENQELQDRLAEDEAKRINYDTLLSENISLKEILGRLPAEGAGNVVLGAILSKPNQSPYDTLVVDLGEKDGLKVGSMVFARGFIPIGRVAEIYPNFSKIILFSTAGEKTQVVVSIGTSNDASLVADSVDQNLFMELVGRGGGNFEMTLPIDIVLVKGNQVVLPSINPRVVAVVETIISDPRDPFTKALLVSPVNIQELKFVQVEK